MGDFTESTVDHEEHNDSSNARTWTLDGHSDLKPQLVLQKRRSTGSGNDLKPEQELKVVFGTVDAVGDPIPTKITIGVNVRKSVLSQSADVTAAIAEFKLLVASTKFDDMVNKSSYYG